MKKSLFVFCPILICLWVSSCSSEPRVSGMEYIGTTKIEYINIKQETRDSISVTLKRFMARLNDKNHFLNGTEIDIVKTYDDLDDMHSFKTFLRKGDDVLYNERGTSFYSDNKIDRIIVVREDSYGWSDKLINGTSDLGIGYSVIPSIRQTLMHEVGHLFDEYFGHDHNAVFAKEWDSLMWEKEKDETLNPYLFDLADAEEEMYSTYKKRSGLSDTQEFKEAYLKDLKFLAKLKETSPDEMPVNWEYYTQEVDWKHLNSKTVENVDQARTETYANAFSYAVGEIDGGKNFFVSGFKNSYKVVMKDIEKYL
ncbi:MAG: hypothetical protein IJ635_09490 [Bacteroidaceae bacterium]|nr:hypothetical protein [Bacteroidaceae bacterium]